MVATRPIEWRSASNPLLDSCARQRNPARRFAFLEATLVSWRRKMGRGILLWLLGVPIPIIILLWLFFGR
jgi:hypothetical protein